MFLPRSVPEKRHVLRPGFWLLSATLCASLVNGCTYILRIQALGPPASGTYLLIQWVVTVAIPIIGTGMSTSASPQISEIQSSETPRIAAGIFYFLWYRQCRSVFLYCIICLILAYPLFWLIPFCQPFFLFLASLAMLPLLLSNIVGITLRSLSRSDLLAI